MNDEPKIFSITKYCDNRGFFYESFSSDLSQQCGQIFVQDNISFSRKGVIRGMHYQWKKPMGKLIHVIKGHIIDYIVDIRMGSENFGTCYSYELNDKNNTVLWAPPGFAHGFETIEESIVMYKCTNFYNKDGESGINPFDEDLKINWITSKKSVIISAKDLKADSLHEYIIDPKF